MSSVYSDGSSRVNIPLLRSSPKLTDSQRPSRVSVPSSFGSKARGSFLDRPYEPLEATNVFSEIDYFKTTTQGDSDLRRKRSFSAKEVAEVAAATRFKLELERREQISTDFEDGDPPVPSNASQSLPLRSTSLAYLQPAFPEPSLDTVQQWEPRQLKRNKTPEPIVVSGIDNPPEEIRSAPLLSSYPPSPLTYRQEERSTKSHRRTITISESRSAHRNMITLHSPSGNHSECTPPLPVLSPSYSVATPKLPDLETPSTLLGWNPSPSEDQIRREMELFTLQDGAESLIDQRYKYEKPPNLRLDSDIDGDELRDFQTRRSRSDVKDDDRKSIVSVTPSSKKRRSIFSVFQRQSEVDKLLDLYLYSESQVEVQPIKKRPSLARRMTRSRRTKGAEAPEVPPLPSMVPPQGSRPG